MQNTPPSVDEIAFDHRSIAAETNRSACDAAGVTAPAVPLPQAGRRRHWCERTTRSKFFAGIEFDERNTLRIWLEIMLVWLPVSTVLVVTPVVLFYHWVIR
ncbi:hypothetical protein [Fodinicola feengrottensis]|uniref:hypothetical protein n=1 Tax=Fodinicola feengrottensis TaxID=435914 RepID=UPI0013D7661A|nr:hypothetical protein [Fodinicola feengrottensis]